MPVRFSSDEVAKLIALASSRPLGRTLAERIAETVEGLDELVPHMGFDVFVLEPARQTGEAVFTKGMEQRDLVDYVTHYRHHDPMRHFLLEARPSVRTLSDAATKAEIARTEYSDLLGRNRTEAIAGWAEPIGEGRLVAIGIQRPHRMDDYTQKERHVIGLVAPLVVAAVAERPRPAGALGLLTARERDVVELVTRGLTDRQVSTKLGIGFATVRTHLQSAFRKLGVSNRVELLHVAIHGRE